MYSHSFDRSTRMHNKQCIPIPVIWTAESKCWTVVVHTYPIKTINVPVQAPAPGHPFYGYSEKTPHFSRLLRCAWGYGWPFLILNPWVQMGILLLKFLPHSNARYHQCFKIHTDGQTWWSSFCKSERLYRSIHRFNLHFIMYIQCMFYIS